MRFVFTVNNIKMTLNRIFRKKGAKAELKSAKEAAIKEEGESPNNLTKVSVTSDVDEEKEKKKDRELLIK